jgi:uncharacterized protein YbjT (DUF2867 family)
MPTILVTTPTGHIGSHVVNDALAAGASVRAFVRDPARLDPAVRARVDVRTGSLDDSDALARAMDGADAAFVLVPPNYTAADWPAAMRAVGRAAEQAAVRAGLPRLVFLSSMGAHRDDLGPVTTLGEIEAALRAARPHVVALRPAYFFENALAAIPTITQAGAIFGNFDPDLAFPQVATRDIGAVAARWLLDPTWQGHHVAGVHGPRDLAMGELADLAGEALGRPVRYVPVPLDAVAAALPATGMTPSVVDGYRALLGGLAASRFERPEARTRETTTPTEFAAWARLALRPAFDASAAAMQPAGV